MNQGGEPAHDDYGLPWVDVEIPDDARELDRDLLAYRRELRALRRIERANRWRAPLRKSGMMVPLIAGCLVMAMIGGMVLTMFSANTNLISSPGRIPAHHAPGFTGPPSAHPRGSASVPGGSRFPASSAPTSASAAASLLPAGTIAAAHRARISLSTLAKVAIAIIPAKCGCADAVRRLLVRAKAAKVTVWLVGLSGSNVSALRRLAPPSEARTAILAIDASNALRSAYRPTRLKVLLVDSNHRVRPVTALATDVQIDSALRSLR